MNRTLSKSRKAVIYCHNRGYRVLDNGTVKSFTGRRLNPTTNNMYYIISIRNKDNKRMKIFVHQLMAYQKFGTKAFEPSIETRHLNSNCLDNSWNNIGIGTHSDNMLDVPKEDRLKRGRNAGRTNSHLIDKDILDMREGFSEGNTLRWAMETYGIAKSTASGIKNRKTYKYL